MKSVIVYDSKWGNTEKIALFIGEALKSSGGLIISRAADLKSEALLGAGLLVVGSPTFGGNASEPIKNFLNKLTPAQLKDVKVAAFDTRIRAKGRGLPMKTLLKVIGYAAPKVLKSLTSKGGTQSLEAEGFFVKDREGPLEDGEIDRAFRWGKSLSGK